MPKERALKTYDAKDIRNVLLVGHGGSGKTTLLEAMLFTAGAITRMGTVEDGNTVSDHDPDEQRKGISVSLSMAPIEWAATIPTDSPMSTSRPVARDQP